MSKPQVWKCMTGRHYVRKDGKSEMICYEPGDKIECTREELGNAVDKFELLEGEVGKGVSPSPKRVAEPKEERYRIKNLGSGRYSVINTRTGKRQNSEVLTRDEALKFMENINPSELEKERVIDERVEA